ncbi:hypothetical protein OEA41_005681 [Lepraria neglecta]|uniref:Azaphilone pigments biosynthesis cluster protein L N-terminal domain-containing protein n=1 Tax=Lepraria neglecta TaxID=209136 RepID=A0AAE0DKA5_9LECA|nr:hypothetical protein OEA41_005681 [Lepraria neglecta]
MDGLSSTASAIAVVSLAVQLADSVKKLCEFWSSVRDAPEDIHAIVTELELLSSGLPEIATGAQHVEPDVALIAVLKDCTLKVKNLRTLVCEIDADFISTSPRIHRWTAFRAVLKNEKIKKFQEALERLKSTLLMAQQNQFG